MRCSRRSPRSASREGRGADSDPPLALFRPLRSRIARRDLLVDPLERVDLRLGGRGRRQEVRPLLRLRRCVVGRHRLDVLRREQHDRHGRLHVQRARRLQRLLPRRPRQDQRQVPRRRVGRRRGVPPHHDPVQPHVAAPVCVDLQGVGHYHRARLPPHRHLAPDRRQPDVRLPVGRVRLQEVLQRRRRRRRLDVAAVVPLYVGRVDRVGRFRCARAPSSSARARDESFFLLLGLAS